MGQGTSRHERSSQERPSGSSSSIFRSISSPQVPSDGQPSSSHTRSRRQSVFLERFTTPLDRSSRRRDVGDQAASTRRTRHLRPGSMILPNLFGRHASHSEPDRVPTIESLSQPSTVQDAPSDQSIASSPPLLQIPNFDELFNIPALHASQDTSSMPNNNSPLNSNPSHGTSPAPVTDRTFRGMTASLRRRRSSLRASDDTSAMLTRLLSAAATATAMSLTGGSPNTSINDLNSASDSIDGDDGSFNGFLQSLRSGRLASSFGNSGNTGSTDGTQEPPASLEFFRMFRFGDSNGTRRRTLLPSSQSLNNSGDAGSSTAGAEEAGPDRMIPVLIVGIRALNDRDATEERNDGMPSFLDSLTTTPTALSAAPIDQGTPDDTQASTPERRRSRRTTIGGLNFFSSDSSRAEEQPRPATSHASPSESPLGPYPPPTTPASPGLSALSSGTTTPTRRSSLSSNVEQGSHSRRDSLYRRLTGTTLEPTLEEQQSQAPNQSRPRGLRRRPRIHSWADGPRHDPRRNGVLMEPSDGTPTEGSSTRSWIIYILGGNYPENHPILTTPSLFTDSPTYEDMLLLANLLGSAKPPVAKAEDVESAGGLHRVRVDESSVTAFEVDGEASINIPQTERCLVCLCEYQDGEELRRLASCQHLFHRECIDQWLTTGRNSCPLCRSQGVEETSSTAAPDRDSTSMEAPEIF